MTVANAGKRRGKRLWVALVGFLLISGLMYGTIMYKIIYYGP